MTKARDLANASTALSAVSATELGYVDGVTSAIQTQIDAKLATATAASTYEAALPSQTGNSGKYLTTDGTAKSWGTVSSAPNFLAGKNAIINGDFLINQRGFTSNTTDNSFNFDRWKQQNFGGSQTVTPQTFTPGAAPASGYEGRTYVQSITASQSAAGHLGIITQRIEDCTRFAGQTITISFWAKANTGTPKIGVEVWRDYGTGGSPTTAESVNQSSITLTTSWARYSVTVAVPSISGKTLGTTANTSYLELNLWQSAGANYNARASSIGIQNFTFSLWGVQVEAGSTATPFTTATGTLQGELAACQRYYYQIGPGAAYASFGVGGFHDSTTAFMFIINTPVVMRTVPTFTTLGSFQTNATGITLTGLGFNGTYSNVASYNGQASCSGATTGYGSSIRNINDTTAKMMFSSEL